MFFTSLMMTNSLLALDTLPFSFDDTHHRLSTEFKQTLSEVLDFRWYFLQLNRFSFLAQKDCHYCFDT